MSMLPVQVKVNLRRLIILRLLVTTLFLCFGIVATNDTVLLYILIITVCFLSLVYSGWLGWGKFLNLLAQIQIAVDLFLECILIFYTGGYDSVYSTLMVVTIFSASMVVLPNGGLSASLLGSVVFFGVVFYQQMRSPSEWLFVAYIAYVKISILVLVGFLSTALARRLHNMEHEIRLRERLSFLGEMTANLAHEIRNPLMSITGSIELLSLELSTKLSREDERLMNTIVGESERLTSLLNQVLNYTQQEHYQLERVPIVELLDEVFLILERNTDRDGRIQIVKKYQSHRTEAEVDRDKMKQVFLNIISNAFYAMPEGGTLTVDTLRRSRALEIKFHDTGTGIQRDVLKRLFVPFAPGRKGGTGIGLAIAQKIVKGHGGNITAKSKKGDGSTFLVTLPAI